MSPRNVLVVLGVALGVLAASCSSSTTPSGPGPGSTPPGSPCATAKDCGCWECTCKGVSGLPGAAQLCVSGKCPSGDEACTPICALANATLQTATAVGMCDGVP